MLDLHPLRAPRRPRRIDHIRQITPRAGQTQVHLAATDLGVAFRTKHVVNPLERGHIAFRTDDIEAFKKRLEEKNIFYSDYGQWAMNGWYQIFFYDPAGNVIEVHQVMND